MIPRFSNPHLILEAARHVSRAEVHADQQKADEYTCDGTTTGPRDDVDVDVALTSLETILKRTLGDIHFDSSDSSSTPGGPKKKRKKLDHDANGTDGVLSDNASVPFRLLSSSKGPRLVSLLPPPPPAIKVLEPASEDTEDEARLRSQQAAEVAMDPSLVLEESRKQYRVDPREASRYRALKIDDGTRPPSSRILILESPKSSSNQTNQRPATAHLPPREKPSPHTLSPDKLHYPIFALPPAPPSSQTHPSPLSSAMKRRLRRIRSKSTTEQFASPLLKAHPTFWRPMQEWGGKSAGYAYGFDNSKPVWSEGARWQPYKRDRMRKAVVVV